MTDWTAATGSGTILLRDTGTSAEFWITAGNSIAYDYSLTWSGTVNGGGVGGTFRYNAGAGWQMLGSWGVSTEQNVTFNKTGDSGSSGLGGPASVTGFFARAKIPGAPRDVKVPAATIYADQVTVTYAGPASNGGAAIDYYLVRVSKNNPPNKAPYTDKQDLNGNIAFTGLEPNTTYYVTVYAHNAKGYGPYGNVVKFTTANSVRVKVGGAWKRAIPYVKVSDKWKKAQPFVKVNGKWTKSS